MGSLNKVMLIGRLGQDPEKRIIPSGQTVVNCSLATSDNFTDRNGDRQERTEWHRLVIWGKQGDTIAQYCRKGSELYVEGRLQTREWQDKDGNRRWTTEIFVNRFQFLGGRAQQAAPGPQDPYQPSQAAPAQPQGNPYGQPGPAAPAMPPQPAGDDFIEDDIPF